MIFPLEAVGLNFEKTDAAFKRLAIWSKAFCFQMHLTIDMVPEPFAIDGGLHGSHTCYFPAFGERGKSSESSERCDVLTRRSRCCELVHDHALVVEILCAPSAGILQLAVGTKPPSINAPIPNEKLELKCLFGRPSHVRGDFGRNLRRGSLCIRHGRLLETVHTAGNTNICCPISQLTSR